MYRHLSEQQKQVLLYNGGHYVVKACPGSGKTHSVAALISRLIREKEFRRKGIASLSFTNVACEEINQKLANHFGIRYQLGYPHLISTLDSFFNNFIFLPFGHLVMKCGCRPKLVGEPHFSHIRQRPFQRYDRYFDQVSYNIKGELVKIASAQVFDFKWKDFNKDGSRDGNIENLQKMKDYFHKKGYANQCDANYFTLEILKKYPLIQHSIANRYEYFIIDEAQDTNEIQMEIINLLKTGGASNIILIGDRDQAIFEWNSAKPDLFDEKYEQWNSIIIDENRRSSQNICNVIKNFSSFPSMVAVNQSVSRYKFEPQIIGYKKAKEKRGEWVVTQDESKLSVNNIVKSFCSICLENNIPITADNVAVLFRGKSQGELLGINNIKNEKSPWKSTCYYALYIVKGKYLMDKGDFNKGYKLLEKGLLYAITENRTKDVFDIEEYIKDLIVRYGSFKKYREKIFSIINRIPSTINRNLTEWIQEVNNLIIKDIVLSVETGEEDIIIEDLFDDFPKISFPYYCDTIHSAKGKTFEAVLVFLGKKDGKNYTTMLNNFEKMSQEEALRIVYVAISRPRKILIIATPEEDVSCWKTHLGILN